jgi:Mannosyltransferase putative/Glycosyltransferase family 9 (heptosyltransferase)
LRRLILKNGQSPGDIVMLTAAVRDLHKTYPGQFLTDVRTPCPALWENNPYLTPLADDDAEAIECEYPLIHRSNDAPYHFIHGFIEDLNRKLGLGIRPTTFRGDIHLSDLEKSWMSQVQEIVGAPTPFWIVVAGGKRDYTAKWWSPARYQEVVDSFRGRIQFVQVGSLEHEHPGLRGVIDLRGRTDLRQLVRLVHHAQGVLCPVSLPMHLAAAVEPRGGLPRNRPCVVVAGGREPPHWEAYPHHQFLHRAGALLCCDAGGCWKSRVAPLGDGDEKDLPQNLCQDVVGPLPRCMDMITAADVIRAIDLYFEGGALQYAPPALAGADLPKPHEQMTVEDLISLCDRPAPVAMPSGWQHWPAAAQAYRTMMRRFIDSLPAYPGGFAGRGVVICAGGPRLFACAYVCARMLRFLGCQLPIQFWHLGAREMDDDMRAVAAELGVACIDAERLRERRPARILNGWELKAYALLHAPFREILLLDADNVPVCDPTYLFDSAEFKARGAVFWPDYQRLAPDRSIWSICEVAYRDEPEIESGQVLIDKPAVFAELALTMWMNEHSDYFYAHIHGDKGTFQMAWRKLDRLYAMPAYGIESLDSTMCQHDFVGRRLFQHRNMDKWRLDGSNPRIRGFLYEDQCRAALADLRQRWTGIVAPPPRATGVSTLLGGETFRYRRVGLDDRPLQFLDGGRIGEGAASCERSWRLGIDGAGEKVLTVAGDASPTFQARWDARQRIWQGRWLVHERMMVELIPIA